MFEITADHISRLSDEDLRSLVGRLCEAELRSRDLSSSAVTWGGNQTARDGGIDVRVALPESTRIDGFIPRVSTGFQVKKPKMPKSEILAEMKPLGTIRPTIRELADKNGAYVIVSSSDSVTNCTLQNRLDAMSEAVQDLPNADALHLEFYDANRLATWLREHEGLIPWVRERVADALQGWRGYGPWAYAEDGVAAQFLADESTRLSLRGTEKQWDIVGGINQIREVLSRPKGVVRLVGLSGVGKTRLAQALFDSRVGESACDRALSVYADMSDDPDPQPTVVASNLIASGARDILVIDNCSSELHRNLTNICRAQSSRLSVLTIEYDIRDDEPEDTEVFELRPASDDVIGKLLHRRFPAVSAVDVRTVTSFSGGNARVAIALCSTIERNETIHGLTNDQLFQRLFTQRNEPSDSLLLTAKACSLVYSFHGEDVSTGPDAELNRLGALVDQNSVSMYRNVSELMRRGLVQKRGPWRAVLPQAIAIRLASLAVQDIPAAMILSNLVDPAPDRLTRSFSRRLGLLHASAPAVAIVEGWFSARGMLGPIRTFDERRSQIFLNVAPVQPKLTLSYLERELCSLGEDELAEVGRKYGALLWSLAYDPDLFVRSATLLIKLAKAEPANQKSDSLRDRFASLFSIYLSGTHATIEQRLEVVSSLLSSDDLAERKLGASALESALEAWHFSSHYNFEFGAWSRDYGYRPMSQQQAERWFCAVLDLCGRLVDPRYRCASLVRKAVADKFRAVWLKAKTYEAIETACSEIARHGFWPEGWIAVRTTISLHSKELEPDILARLASLERQLRPKSLADQVRGTVLPDQWNILDIGSDERVEKRLERLYATAEALGAAVAADSGVFSELLPELVSRTGSLWAFARGLVIASEDRIETWKQTVAQYFATEELCRNLEILRGYVRALFDVDNETLGTVLDHAVADERLGAIYPILEAAKPIDSRAINRLMRSLELGRAPIHTYRSIEAGRVSEAAPADEFKRLLIEIASKQNGSIVAVHLLTMRIFGDKDHHDTVASELVSAGRELFEGFQFTRSEGSDDYHWGQIAKDCLVGEEGARIVSMLCGKLRQSISGYETQLFYHDELLQALFTVQPVAVLNGLFATDSEDTIGYRWEGVNEQKNPIDVLTEETALGWCDADPELRYPALARVVTMFRQDGAGQNRTWTGLALDLLKKAPDRVEMLKVFTSRLRPGGWVGTYSAALAANAKMLEQLPQFEDPNVASFIRSQKERLGRMVREEEERESASDRARDERFE